MNADDWGMVMGSQRNWSQEEKDYLQDNWGAVSIKHIATRLQRTIDAVDIKKNRMRLGRFLDNGEYITFNQLFKALNIIGGGYTTQSWIKNKKFPIKYKTVNNCRFKVVYLKDFWEWADINRSSIDWSRVEKNILGIEPEWVQRQRKADFLRNQRVKTGPWSVAEDQKLKYLLKQFQYTWPEISKILRRTEGAIQRRISDLQIKERPLKADNHIPWTDEEFDQLAEMIKQSVSYELMSEALGKSTKAIRSKAYCVYLTENLNKVASMIGNGNWGDGRPELTISHRLLSAEEKTLVKKDISIIAGILKSVICKHYDDNDYWQKELCSNWDNGCKAGEINCDSCTSFVRILPQYCKRCGATFMKRKKADICERCAQARKKQHQKKWAVLHGNSKSNNPTGGQR